MNISFSGITTQQNEDIWVQVKVRHVVVRLRVWVGLCSGAWGTVLHTAPCSLAYGNIFTQRLFIVPSLSLWGIWCTYCWIKQTRSVNKYWESDDYAGAWHKWSTSARGWCRVYSRQFYTFFSFLHTNIKKQSEWGGLTTGNWGDGGIKEWKSGLVRFTEALRQAVVGSELQTWLLYHANSV